MAQIVKLRRSSVSGQKPTNTNLQLGELALNTTDGKVFMAVSGSGGPSVEELIVTNAVNTGSINVSGSIRLIGNETISGSLYLASSSLPEIRISNLDYSQSYHITVGNYGFLNLHDGLGNYVALFGTSSANFINNVYASNSLHVVNNVTAAYFSGSFIGDASGLTNVPFVITGSDVDGNSYDKVFTKLQFDDSTGLNVSESVPGTAFISIGSHFRDIFVSGSGMLRATGSDAFEVIGENGIEIFVSNIDTNYDGYTKELKFSALTLSSSLNNRIDNITGSLNTFTSSTNLHLQSLDNFTSSVVLTSETSSMSVLSASYALTAAFALNAGAGGGGTGEGRTARLDQTVASTTWSFTHNLGEQYPTITIFDSEDNVIIPGTITAVDSNNISITFPSAQSGHAVATVGGGLPYLSGSYTGYVLSEVSGAPGWKGGMISGSLQIANFGYATTGSNTFVGDEVIEGTLTIRDAQFKQFTTTGITVGSYSITEIASALYDGAFFDYVIKDGTNKRIGTVMATWQGSNVVFNEISTVDIGDTSSVVMSVTLGTGVAQLRAIISSGTWDFKTLIRGI